MPDHTRLATQLELDGHATLKRAGHLLSMAETLKAMPSGNAPTAELRRYLAGLGFCVVAADALAYAELTMRENDRDEYGLARRGAFEKAYAAVLEALTCTNHPRLERSDG